MSTTIIEKPKRVKRSAAFIALEKKLKEEQNTNEILAKQYEDDVESLCKKHKQELEECRKPVLEVLSAWSTLAKIMMNKELQVCKMEVIVHAEMSRLMNWTALRSYEQEKEQV